MSSISSAKSVLLLSTFPCAKPRHGGQIRLKNIRAAYESAGCDVTAMAIYPEESYSTAEYSDMDFPFPASSIYRKFQGRNIPFLIDYMSGIFAIAENGGWPAIRRRLSRKFDIIHVEQPWLWELGIKLNRQICNSQAVMVYGSENIEAPLKASIFQDYDLDHQDVLDAIKLLEQKASQEADIVAAVTDEELKTLQSWGAKVLVLAANGVEQMHAAPATIDRWRSKLPEAPWLLYVASAHPPNFTALDRIFAGSLGCFPPNSRLVVAGSVGEHAYRVLSECRWGALNQSRLQILFQLDDEDLAAVKHLAHGFVLPIGSGGGSNLKTAEALFSGSYIVGTSTAFRGFEQFGDAAGVMIADNPTAFHDSIRDVLARPRCEALKKKGEADMRCELLWSNRLRSMVDMAMSFVGSRKS